MSMDRTKGETFTFRFSTRAFATGIPTALAGSPVLSAMEDAVDTAITTGVTFTASSVAGLSLCTIDSSQADFEAGKEYDVYLSAGTVGGVSAVGEVVGHFSLSREAAAVDLANGTDGLGAIKAETALIVADTGELQTDWVNAGRLDAILDAINAKTTNLPTDPADQSLVIVATDANLAAIAALDVVVDTVKAETALIVADTNELQTDDYPTRFTTIEALIGDLGSGSAGISVVAESSVETVAGAPTNTFAATEQLDGVYHIVPDDGADDTDMYYQFDIGAFGIPIEVEWVGYAQTNNETYDVFFWNWVDSAWNQVGVITGTAGTTEQQHTYSATVEHVGTGGNVGKVRFRFLSAIGAVIATDRILCDYAVVLDTSVASILADTNELQIDWTNAGRLDALIDAIKAATDNLPSDPADQSLVIAATDAIIAAIAALDTVVDTVKAETALIVADTNELQTDDLPTLIAAVQTVVDALDTLTKAAGDGDLAAIKVAADAVKVVTDKFVFTTANQVDANTLAINSATVVGDGSATPWDGA